MKDNMLTSGDIEGSVLMLDRLDKKRRRRNMVDRIKINETLVKMQKREEY